MEFNDMLTLLARDDGSDLYLSTGAPPSAKFQGQLKQLAEKKFEHGDIEKIANEVMSEDQQKEFHDEMEMNLAYSMHDVGRFRINIFKG